MMRQKPILSILLTIFLLTACHQKTAYHHLLVEADSAMVHGKYRNMEQFLHTYRISQKHENKEDAMYCRLLEVCYLYKQGLPMPPFSTIDSLLNYYKGSQHALYGRVLLCAGYVCQKERKLPESMNYYRQAATEAEKASDAHLLCWLYRLEGDLYAKDEAYENCIEPYRKHYQYACINRDTVQMAFGACNMGLVYTYLDDVDSTLFYYLQAIKLASPLEQADDIVPYARGQLANIYIQIEEYDKAKAYMDRTPRNDANWAYLYLWQNQLDSAIYYFKRCDFDIYGHATRLRTLAELELKRGNPQAAIGYYQEYAVASDSAQALSAKEETERTAAQYDYTQMEQQRDEARHEAEVRKWVIVAAVMLLAALVLGACVVWQRLSSRRSAQQQRIHRLEQERDEARRTGEEQAAKNRAEVSALRQKMALMANDAEAVEQMETTAQLLETQTQAIEAKQRSRALLEQQLRRSPLYSRVMSRAGSEKLKMTDSEWDELQQLVDATYGGMTRRLVELAGKLSTDEVRICLLRKLGLKQSEIAAMLGKTQASVGMARIRIYQRITGKQTKASEFDDYLLTVF